jgi:carboxypeptidase Q
VLDIHPRRTIRIGLWSGEEEGLLGSQSYVEHHFGFRPPMNEPLLKDMPTLLRRQAGDVTVKPEQAKVSAYFNVDNGTGKIRGVYLQENEAVAPIFKAWMEPFKDLGMTTLTMRNTGGTDHLSFDAVGIPGFQFIQDPIEYETRTHHSNMDVYDRLQPDDLKQAAVIVASFVYDAAMSDRMLPRKPNKSRSRPHAKSNLGLKKQVTNVPNSPTAPVVPPHLCLYDGLNDIRLSPLVGRKASWFSNDAVLCSGTSQISASAKS